MGFFQAKHVFIKMDSFFQIGDPVTGMKELANHRPEIATYASPEQSAIS